MAICNRDLLPEPPPNPKLLEPCEGCGAIDYYFGRCTYCRRQIEMTLPFRYVVPRGADISRLDYRLGEIIEYGS